MIYLVLYNVEFFYCIKEDRFIIILYIKIPRFIIINKL